MTKAPLVSIVIPVYNGAAFLRDAIESALSQTYPNAEVIVINDGSNDDGQTERVALSYGSRLQYFHKENGGVASALNLSIEKMRGKYWSWLSHDDKYAPEKVSMQVEALESFGQEAIAYSDFTTISEKGQIIENCFVSPKGKTFMRALLAMGTENVINGCTLMVPRSVFGKYGLFDITLRYTQDYNLWFTFASHLSFVYVAALLVQSRQHAKQGGKLDPVGATKEGDTFHYRATRSLAEKEVDGYLERDFSFLLGRYRIWSNAGFLKTSYIVLRHLLRIASSENELQQVSEILNELIFRLGENGLDQQTLAKLRTEIIQPSQSPTIMFFSNVWLRGGLERVLSVLFVSLRKKYRIILVSTNQLEGRGYEITDEVLHLKIDASELHGLSSRLAALSVLLDVEIFIGNSNQMIELLDVYGLLTSLDVKSIAANHNNFFLPYHMQWLYPLLSVRIESYENASAVTWSTRFGSWLYAQLCSNSTWMPNPSVFKAQTNKAATSGDRILAIGRFYDSIKRIDRVLEVFSKVIERRPQAHLYIVGGLDENARIPGREGKTVRQFANSLNLPADNLHFEGEREDVEQYYRSSSVLLLCSESEGFGLVLAEAGTFGLPCVTFDIPGIDDIIINGQNGFVVPNGQVEIMAQKVIQLLSDPTLYERTSKSAIALSARFDSPLVCARWEKLIDAVLNAPNQEALNKILTAVFIDPVENATDFANRIVKEYEKHIAMLFRPSIESRANEVPDTRRARTAYARLARKLIGSLRSDGVLGTALKLKRKVASWAAE